MGDINGVWDELRDNWHLATVVLLALLGFDLGVHDVATDRGGVTAILTLHYVGLWPSQWTPHTAGASCLSLTTQQSSCLK